MRILVTGSAGFIGYHVAHRLLREGHAVTGIDAMVPYYDVTLKQKRHAMLAERAGFQAHVIDIADAAALAPVFAAAAPEVVIHLAAQAGVRYALDHPDVYVATNVTGSFNVVEASRRAGVGHLLMASTSSAYGANQSMPFHENDPAVTPLTIYAATKLASEDIGHCYAHLWNLPTTVFRFFTVYGPWGRPDMALFKFTDAILRGRPIDIHNHGEMARDFTYVDDIVEAILRLVPAVPRRGEPVGAQDSLSPVAPWRLVNIGNGAPIGLLDFIAAIERALGREAIRNYLPMQPGEVVKTWADTALLHDLTGFRPATEVGQGVAAFVAWFRGYYGL